MFRNIHLPTTQGDYVDGPYMNTHVLRTESCNNMYIQFVLKVVPMKVRYLISCVIYVEIFKIDSRY